jgi:hypothetical protein
MILSDMRKVCLSILSEGVNWIDALPFIGLFNVEHYNLKFSFLN